MYGYDISSQTTKNTFNSQLGKVGKTLIYLTKVLLRECYSNLSMKEFQEIVDGTIPKSFVINKDKFQDHFSENLQEIGKVIDQFLCTSDIFLNEFETNMRKAADYQDLGMLFDLLFKVRSQVSQLQTYCNKVICSNFNSKIESRVLASPELGHIVETIKAKNKSVLKGISYFTKEYTKVLPKIKQREKMLKGQRRIKYGAKFDYDAISDESEGKVEGNTGQTKKLIKKMLSKKRKNTQSQILISPSKPIKPQSTVYSCEKLRNQIDVDTEKALCAGLKLCSPKVTQQLKPTLIRLKAQKKSVIAKLSKVHSRQSGRNFTGVKSLKMERDVPVKGRRLSQETAYRFAHVSLMASKKYKPRRGFEKGFDLNEGLFESAE